MRSCFWEIKVLISFLDESRLLNTSAQNSTRKGSVIVLMTEEDYKMALLS